MFQYNTYAAEADAGKTNQWLGVSVRSGGPGKGVVTCAHRYKELKQSGSSVNIYGIGSCYQMTQELAYDTSLGKGNHIRPCQGLSKTQEHEEYAFCQSGISSYITEDERLVIGSPGAINWLGMVTEIDVSPFFRIKKLYNSPTQASDPIAPPVPLISYLGYSVIGGKFDSTGRTYFVAGAPRSVNVGQVVFFTETTGRMLQYEQSQILTGELAFSGYGQDLIAVDINNDGYDDLVVGCPFYYVEEKDNIRLGGAIYVYIGNGDIITKNTKPQIIRGRSLSQAECDDLECLHARFGFSLTNAGDLNRDGFEDFAVGAPYEGQGAVYIFHGSADGVKEPFSQRIYAKDIKKSSAWQTFGYSLSGGLDLDGNTYPDLLIGSYMEDKVALLRTRPIISLHSKVTVTPDKLNMSTDAQRQCSHNKEKWYCVVVKLCLRYTAEPVERFNTPVEIIYTIIAEPERLNSRVEFLKDGSFTQKIEDTFRLLSQDSTGLSADDPNARYACISQTAYLKNQITDVLSAIEFGIQYRLPERTSPISTPRPGALPDINDFPILDAGINQAESSMVFAQVEFAKECGQDQICKSNLQMKVKPQLRKNSEDQLVLEIGASDTIRVAVDIENIGEIAYQTAFYFNKPEALTWQQSEPKDIGCIPYNTTLIECKDIGSKELGKPLKPGAVTEFALIFQVQKQAISTVRSIELTAWVNTTSEEVTPAADRITIPIVVYINADLQVSGQSEPDSSIPYSGVIRGESAIKNERMIGQSVNHTYTVYNNGPGVVESSDITIYWPYEMASDYPHGKHLLYLMHPPEVLVGDAFCFDQPEIVNVIGIPEANSVSDQPRLFNVLVDKQGPEYTVDNGRKRRQAKTAANKPMEIREDGPKVGASSERKNIATFDCMKKTAKCYEIRCRIGVLNKNQAVKIRLRARLWESTLLEDFREVDEVRIRSTGKIHIRPELNVVQSNTTNDLEYATTIAIPSIQIVQEKPLAWWIYALAVLGGILVLIILALCLWKIGFFKRKRYDDVSTYNVKVEKKKNINNPTYSTKVETKKEYLDENEYFLKQDR
ncbi:Integrin alpha [Mactra antiquata]